MSFIGKWFRKWFSANSPQSMSHADAEAYRQLHQAHACLMSGDLEEAARLGMEAFQQTRKNNPSLSEYALGLLVFIWMEQELYEKATDFVSRYIAENPPNPSAFRDRGMAYWYAGRLTEALADYESAARLLSNDPFILVARGQVLVELNQPQRAIQDLHAAIDIISKYPNARTPFWVEAQAYARNGLGFAYSALSKNTEAMHQFEMSIDLRPENAWVYFNRAQACEKAGEPARALRDYQKSLELTKPKLPAYKRDFAKARVAIHSG